ncbi:MAG: 30S ribosomal protein S20 [bacterium JZ-2024 1]
MAEGKGKTAGGKITKAEKRHRQSEERRRRNRYYVSTMKTAIKKARIALMKKDLALAPELVKEAIKKIQKAGSKKAIHRNEVRRRLSRLMSLAHKVLSSSS